MDIKSAIIESRDVRNRTEKTGLAGDEYPAGTASWLNNLILSPVSRRPLRLPEETVRAVSAAPMTAAAAAAARPRFEKPEKDGCKRVSIIIVTFNNLVCTKLCLSSLLVNTDYPNYEVIVIDNASEDDTAAYLKQVSRLHDHVRVVFNDRNLGFAPANNQGLELAAGEIMVLLNNDTILPPGWLAGLVKHLEDQSIGLLGPVTNRIGNEAEIEVPYRTYGELMQFARDYPRRHSGELFDIRTLCMYCLAMRREVYEHLGPLDEQYEVGMLEDDDYSMRAHAGGYRVVCAEDVFVHHFGQASFGNLFASGEYARLLEVNGKRFEKKWGVKWEPYGRRLSRRYLQTYGRLREAVTEVAPTDASVLVVSKGDPEIIKLDGVRAAHFPQNERGEYAGFYPADGEEAVARLEELRVSGGAEFLVFPQSAFWWLEHYAEFKRHLETRHKCVWSDEASIIYRLLENI